MSLDCHINSHDHEWRRPSSLRDSFSRKWAAAIRASGLRVQLQPIEDFVVDMIAAGGEYRRALLFDEGLRGEPLLERIQDPSSLAVDGDAMKELIEYLVRSLVDKPENVMVHEVHGESATVYEVSVADGELGQIIGRQGRTILAIRTIVMAAASKENKRVVLDLLE